MKHIIFITTILFLCGVQSADAITSVNLSSFHTFTAANSATQALGRATVTGDINGDGYADVLFSDYINPDTANGVVYLFYGGTGTDLLSGNISTSSADATFTGVVENTGFALATGDLNNDGYDDIAISAQSECICAGRVSIVYGKAAAFSGATSLSSASASFTGITVLERAGATLSMGGDVNNDGFEDLLIGSDNESGNPGTAYLVYGQSAAFSGTESLSAAADVIFTGEDNSDGAGTGVSLLGDINNDGFEDILISAPFYVNATGRAYLIYGQSAALATTIDLSTVTAIFNGRFESDNLGERISAGDINNDGFDDLFFSATDATGDAKGLVYVVYGQSAAFTTTTFSSASIRFSGEVSGDNATIVFPVVSDINKDGFGDVMIGAPEYDVTGATNAGAVYLVYGQSTAFSGENALASAAVRFTTAAASEGFGANPTFIGDINNDRYLDLFIAGKADQSQTMYFGYMGMDADRDTVLASTGLLYTGTDCNDSDATVSANQTYYRDADGDGLGNASSTTSVCQSTPPTGYVTNTTDTNDNDADNDASEAGTDCNDADATISANQTYYQDADEDGLGNASQTTSVCQLTAPTGYVTNDDDTNDTIKNNGLEISGDSVDNDGDGTIDEKNTIAQNGVHPHYGATEVSSTEAYTAAITEIKGAADGKLIVTFTDNAIYAYTVFDIDTDNKTIVKSWKGTGYILVLHPKGKKLALVNVYTGAVKEKETLSEEKKYGKNSLKTYDLRGDGSIEVIITSKQDKAVRLHVIKIKPNKENKLIKKATAKATHSKVDVAKTQLKKKKINLRKSDSTVLFTYLVNSDYTLTLEQ